MFRKIFLLSIFIILTYGFWVSPDFKEIAAGVAIFLFGMISLEEGFKAFTGGALEKVLKVSTNSQWKSVGFGFITTTVMQSSSLVSVISISFLSAGLLDLAAGIGIIFGANIGTTTGAWLVAGLGLKVKISAYAMPMLVFGVILLMQKNKHVKGFGYILAGLGFLFLGISYMKEGFEAFKGSIDLARFAMDGLLGLFFFAFIGILATVVMQSSHATLVLIITALAVGQITYENALALAIGANVGTTVTAVIAALSANVEGKRLAGAHFIFNVVTGGIAIAFLNQFLLAVDWTSNILGIAPEDYTLKLAVFHTLFNVTGVLVMWPFIGKMVTFLETRLPKVTIATEDTLHLNDTALDFPETAVVAIRNETLHMYGISVEFLCDGISLPYDEICESDDLHKLVKKYRTVTYLDIDEYYETKIKGLSSAIIQFISQAAFTWEVEQSQNIHWLRSASQNIIEAVKDMKHLRKNMSTCMLSTNGSLRDHYDLLRIQIAHIIKVLAEMGNTIEKTDSSEVLLICDTLKVEIKAADTQFNYEVISSLHHKNITAKMASSLMNDNHYTTNIVNNLISMATTIYAVYDIDKLGIERELALNTDEIESLITP
ncbi:MAG: Na/Pi symporter [Colwellia sp.]